MSTNSPQRNCNTAIKNYISNIIRSNKKASLADFIEDNLEFIVANTKNSEDYKNSWISRFNRAAKDFEAFLYEEPPNWIQVEKALTERAITLPPSQPTPTTPTDSSEQAKKLNADDKKRIAAVYDKMIESNMWRLETGKYVEKEMKVVALEQEYEHPAHSVIMGPTDPIWEKRFNAEELYELRNYTVPVIPELPAPLEQFVESFEGKFSISSSS
ncbi:hypothetical protein BDB00DRAFT_790134 [Zychaea mexicana]|uniref:uncharacterized protein n=1 Tax=Zychaea mexicana TaxID=64656 RepID=UPI0022FEB8D6|nr:uncharacterized protein BDB00DRAFT_790134 [Zychaea mexicana]KAI9490753.1 hypothetical protein BDB00DRAFT_790134 [Zychaea mexicana]